MIALNLIDYFGGKQMKYIVSECITDTFRINSFETCQIN